jgi:patatin-related protein
VRPARVVVDVIAGTSAGGLNGAVLAAAIARDVRLPTALRNAWMEYAALTKTALLQSEGGPPKSLLAGDFFHEKIREIFCEVVSDTKRRSDPDKDRSRVTLFVTATALGGKPITVCSEAKPGERAVKPFALADHRRLYRFRHDPELQYRQGQTQPSEPEQDDFGDFGEKGLEALACAVRASASYPVAFAPVSETPLLEEGYRVFPKASTREQPWTWLMDGGVLDNSPFDPVLEELASRPVDRRYRRVVAYVVPSSGMPERTHGGPPPRPAWPSVVSQAIQLPRESDFRSDIEQLEHTLRVAAESPLRML